MDHAFPGPLQGNDSSHARAKRETGRAVQVLVEPLEEDSDSPERSFGVRVASEGQRCEPGPRTEAVQERRRMTTSPGRIPVQS